MSQTGRHKASEQTCRFLLAIRWVNGAVKRFLVSRHCVVLWLCYGQVVKVAIIASLYVVIKPNVVVGLRCNHKRM